MTILVTGGGSGGHITPILAVARELKKQQPEATIIYVSKTGDPFDDVPAADKNIDEILHVPAGKFRRYHGEGWKQLLDMETMRLNIIDAFRTLQGIWQSYLLLRKYRPGIIFTRGSYVSVPVCLAAALLGIPYVTHDSDAIPSLTNRIIGRWAAVHAVALPEELYPYPIDKTVTVGVPISTDYRTVDDTLRQKYKEQLGLGGYEWVVLVTGGGLGAASVNKAVVENADVLLNRYKGLAIIHVAGRQHADEINAAYDKALDKPQRGRVIVKGFITDMHKYSGAANLVIARGGATNLAELAVQAKPSIIIPASQLTGGHQIKNTEALAKAGAIVQLTDEQVEQELRLSHVISGLLDDPGHMAKLSQQFYAYARPDAAQKIAQILIQKARA
jgi:UDP-N-acetylglucosamine--N-acetylmuramyl-(pentapeptide) pyrophosphoryl-undecaprenol N-acetylglucosamine transferase